MLNDAPYKLRIAARTLLAGALVAVAADYLLRVFDLSRKSYGEGPILALVERMRTEPISAEWLRGPDYTLSCYGPAFYLAFDLASRAGAWPASIVPGRMVSLLAALATAGLAVWAVRRRTQSLELGLLAALVFLASPTVSYWMPYARVDMLALFFALAAYIAVGPSRASVIAAAAMVAAGSLAKPTIALAAGPILAHLLINRRTRDAVTFAVLVPALGGAAWCAAQWLSHGFFLSAVLSGNRNPMLPWRGYAYGYAFLASPLGTAAGITAAWLLISEPAKTWRSLFGLGFLASLAVSVVIVCKQGSDHNYFLEPALLGSLLIAAYGAPRLCAMSPTRATVTLAALAVVLAIPSVREVKTRLRQPRMPEEYASVGERLRADAADVGVLADGEWIDAALAAGHAPLVNDPYLYTLLVANGTLDSSDILAAVEQGRVKWLLLDHTLADHRLEVGRNPQMWPAEVIDAMQRNYDLLAHDNEVFVYRHRRFGDGMAAAEASAKGAR